MSDLQRWGVCFGSVLKVGKVKIRQLHLVRACAALTHDRKWKCEHRCVQQRKNRRVDLLSVHLVYNTLFSQKPVQFPGVRTLVSKGVHSRGSTSCPRCLSLGRTSNTGIKVLTRERLEDTLLERIEGKDWTDTCTPVFIIVHMLHNYTSVSGRRHTQWRSHQMAAQWHSSCLGLCKCPLWHSHNDGILCWWISQNASPLLSGTRLYLW